MIPINEMPRGDIGEDGMGDTAPDRLIDPQHAIEPYAATFPTPRHQRFVHMPTIPVANKEMPRGDVGKDGMGDTDDRGLFRFKVKGPAAHPPRSSDGYRK